MLILHACEGARKQRRGREGGAKSEGGVEVREGDQRRERERKRGARLYLISARVSIEQKVQQAGSTVKPWVLLRVCACLKDCVEVIKCSAEKQEHGIAGRIVFNQVRTKGTCNFHQRAEKREFLTQNIQLWHNNASLLFYSMMETFSRSINNTIAFIFFPSPSLGFLSMLTWIQIVFKGRGIYWLRSGVKLGQNQTTTLQKMKNCTIIWTNYLTSAFTFQQQR